MNLVLGQTYEVVVKYIKPRKGIVVEFQGTEETSFIHVSRISSAFVSNIEDFVTCGEILTAECVEGLAHPLELSLIHLGLECRPQESKRYNSKPKYTQVIHEVEKMLSKPAPTLDEMIAKSNQDLKDKMQARKARYDRK